MEEKIRLAVFGQKRLSREGGVEIVVKELCTRMAQNGCDVTCYNRAGHHVSGAEYDKTIEYDGIRQKVVPTIEKKGLAAVSSSFFAALYSAFGRYDVVHIHAEGPAFFCWIPKLFGKRVISTIHGLDWAREKWKFGVGSKFIRQGEKNAVKYADEIIVLSKGVQKYFMETYGRETHFIPNGVNRPQIRKASLITDKFGLKKDSYILFLGRLVPEKGIRYLVEAFKNVKTDKKLVIAGGSSDTDSFMEELKELAKGDERILFTGFVQGAMLDELYSNAYIYTLPSDLEGMPLSLLEAMSYGNCCLVSDIPECAEVVEDKALIFKKSDVEDLREKLQDACDHPEMVIRMKNQAADFICEKYNWDKVVKETITRKLAKLILTLLTLPLLVVVWLLKWFVTFLHCCSAWIFYLLGSVLLATAVLSFLMKQSQGIEALQMLIGGFVIFMIPQVVGSVVVFLELAAATIRQVWYI